MTPLRVFSVAVCAHRCWVEDPKNRPNFEAILKELTAIYKELSIGSISMKEYGIAQSLVYGNATQLKT